MTEIKTMEGWREHALETGDSHIDSYLNVGDRVAQELVDHFAGASPPRTMREDLFQSGMPCDLRVGGDGEKRPTYRTYAKDEEGWRFCGPCFVGETIEPDPTGREPLMEPPEYAYLTGYDEVERVRLVVGAYEFGNGLFVGLECFEPETSGTFEYYGDVTVNIDPLPPFFASIDTNNNNAERIVNFLEGNGIASKTPLVQASGYCVYPVMEFNPLPLLQADPERTVEYMVSRGIPTKEIDALKEKALGSIGKYIGRVEHEPLDQLKQEAKARASEKNAEHSKPAGKDRGSDLER